MPESFIIKRWDAEIGGLKAEWQKARKALSRAEWDAASEIVKKNVFDEKQIAEQPKKVSKFLSYYLISRDSIKTLTKKEKEPYIKKFEASCTREISETCQELLASC